jgi:putative oxidoreductase
VSISTLTAKVTAPAARLLAAAAFLPPLATRITIGLGFYHTGTGKWRNFEHTVEFFTSVGIPFARANAAFIASLEVVGGLLLLVGLLTRLSATLLAGSMTVALLTADRHDFIASWGSASESSPTDVASFVFLLFLLWLIVYGAGPISLDRLVGRLRGVSPGSAGGSAAGARGR